ncbi:MBL fold metallo-hydrolase [Dyadobacter sp. CY345]|uniref:MBL fold metallo-hydrolase n=1 Tax=Dyadobacter sp. CY345 TaxID=2909335 RepID=UPI001F484937|nr:MBL fold metallo-hydrolase [Dyadobacter sp. CY345]MCF2446668.1 MBL fold metallo-hydrolase [Dyadobacter sp. CY345]
MSNQNEDTISRRRFIATAGLISTAILTRPESLFSQKESPVITIMRAAATAKINVTKLRGNVSVLEGSGGNISVLHGPDGKLMVDAGIGVSRPNVLNALNSLSGDPIKMLINSHWHFDHADGNAWVHEEGATIIAHENTRKHLETTVKVDDWDYTFPPAPRDGLPTVLFKDQHMVDFNGESIQIKKYKPAHTDSDLSIYFPKADVLHVADTLWNSYYPFIDYSTGGNIDGMILAAQANIERTTNKTIVVPGHGEVGNRADLVAFHEMLVTIREKVAKQKKEGKSLEEIVASKPTAAYDAKWGGFVISGATFTYLVYKGV